MNVRQSLLNFFEQDVASMLESNPDLKQELKDIVQFQLDGDNGGKWYIDISLGKAVQGVHEQATCTVVSRDEVFAALLEGPTAGWIDAYLKGAVKLKGNLVRALKIRKLFEKYSA